MFYNALRIISRAYGWPNMRLTTILTTSTRAVPTNMPRAPSGKAHSCEPPILVSIVSNEDGYAESATNTACLANVRRARRPPTLETHLMPSSSHDFVIATVVHRQPISHVHPGMGSSGILSRCANL